MPSFHDRLRGFIKQSGYDYKRLSLEIGQGERYISNLLSTGSDPGWSSVLRICSVLNLTPNQLIGLDDQLTIKSLEDSNRLVSMHAESLLTTVTNEAHRRLRARGVRPSFDDVLLWWHKQGGLLANFDRLANHVDLFDPPTADTSVPLPKVIGSESLVSSAFGVADADQLRRLQSSFDPDLCKKVVFAHVETTRGKPVLSIEQIDVTLPGRTFPARFEYKRLLLPVHDRRGNKYVLTYSQALE